MSSMTLPGPVAAPRPRRGLLRLGADRAWKLTAAEAAVAFGSCLLLPLLVRHLDVDPMSRLGAVSGLAAIQLRFALLGLVLVAALVAARRLGDGRWFPLATRLSCAALAGLASGFVAAGAVVSLLGTPWPMFGLNGDSGRIVAWATTIMHGHANPEPIYPPLPLYSLALFAKVFHGGNAGYAFKDLEILGAAITGPLAYLCWRMLYSPIWATVVGIVPMMALIDSYKPYSATVLILLLPVLAAFLRAFRRSAEQEWRPLLLTAGGLGLLLALLLLTYSGWFVWSAAGTFAAVLLLFPWRSRVPRARLRSLAFLGATAAVFLAAAGWYVVDLLQASGTADRDYGFDAYTDPAFFSMWRTDMPGQVGQWPPPGEIGGVSVFTALLFVALAVALWLGLRRSVVLATVAVFGSAWLMRMYFASQMYGTGEVQLWIRTDNQLLYCGLVFVTLAVWLAVRRAGSRLPARGPAVIGVFCALIMLVGSMGSSQSDRYMPQKTNTYQILPWVSQTVRMTNGKCPRYAPQGKCSKNGDQSWLKMIYYRPTN
ncbi:hypothetical protein GXW83_30150 [Streptacidiphilus sp. PB12-B1b]|uniref:hypothetical protein n=1 Tax=Streptacidiphilus sp. PB12-B1b TaxID=2705012 RepID=UPI0015FB6A68|nr:hypothetical protein [Streptacidiphilus sp. PB12-B1b]QMU79340.1 hypothetical protein GXW83_30150 [Streptacidiphilus sp. PB12-B1b]